MRFGAHIAVMLDAAARPARLDLRGHAVRLDAPANSSAKTWPRWLHVADEGLYLGHPSGPFEFNERIFTEIVRNFRALPEYSPGADGVGASRVIPFDWRHASERRPTDGGADAMASQAAVGWALDLDIRRGAIGLQLWAFADMLPKTRELIDEGAIAWTSVSVFPEDRDRKSGDPIGCYLSSIALTNDPFIRGMQAVNIAAERCYYIGEPPSTAGDLVEALRCLFGLPAQAPLVDVLRELMTLRASALEGAAAAPGVDVVKIVGCLRRLFNLATLATAADVFAAADKLLGAVANEGELAALAPVSLTAARAAPQENPTMKIEELIALLAGRLSCAPTADAVATAAPIALDRLQFDASAAKEKLGALLGALGVQDQAGALEKITSMIAQVQALLEVMPELGELVDGAMAAEDAAAEEDMGMVAATMRGLPEHVAKEAKVGIFFARTRGIDLQRLPRLQDGKLDCSPLLDPTRRKTMLANLRQRVEAREIFRKNHGEPTRQQPQRQEPPAQHSQLFQRFFAPPESNGGNSALNLMRGGAQLQGSMLDRIQSGAGGRLMLGATDANGAGNGRQGALTVPSAEELAAFPGANPTAKALAYVRQHKLAKGASFDAEHEAASRLLAEVQRQPQARAGF